MLSTTQATPSVIQESITVLVEPPDESNEETSSNMEDNDDGRGRRRVRNAFLKFRHSYRGIHGVITSNGESLQCIIDYG